MEKKLVTIKQQPAEVNFIGPSCKQTDFSSQGTPHTKQPYGTNFKNNKYKNINIKQVNIVINQQAKVLL